MTRVDDKPALAGLTAEQKRDLLRRLLAEKLAAGNTAYPLSYGQHALWFLHRMLPGSASYHVAIPARVSPPLDRAALERAMADVLERHPALRTVIRSKDGVPEQQAGPVPDHLVTVFERDGVPEETVREELLADYRRPFALDGGLPIRVSLYRRGGEDLLLVTAHHIVFDAFSAAIFFGDLRLAYEAAVAGTRPAFAPAGATYRDFVEWQRRMLEEPAGAEHAAYWSGQLAGELPTLRLPFPGSPGGEDGSLPWAMEPDGFERVRALARAHGTTPFTVILAAWAILLARAGGLDQVIVGIPASGRTRAEWSSVVGYFVNTLPTRVRVRRDADFAAHVDAVVALARGTLAHQDYPLPLIVDRAKVRRDSGRTPLFQAILNVIPAQRNVDLGDLYQATTEGVRFGASRLHAFPMPQQEGQFDVSLELAETHDRMSGTLKYRGEALTRDEAAALGEQFRALLFALVDEPARAVGSVPLTLLPGAGGPDEERDELVL